MSKTTTTQATEAIKKTSILLPFALHRRIRIVGATVGKTFSTLLVEGLELVEQKYKNKEAA